MLRSASRCPISMIRPARSIATRSHTASTSLRTCDDSTTVWPRFAPLDHEIAKNLLHERVEAGGRFVEQHQIGLRRKGRDQQDLLAVAMAVRADLLVGRELEALDELVAVSRIDRTVYLAQELQRLGTGERWPQVRLGRHIGESSVDRRCITPGVEAEDLRAARRRPDQTQVTARSLSTCRLRSGPGSRTLPRLRSRGRARPRQPCARNASRAARYARPPEPTPRREYCASAERGGVEVAHRLVGDLDLELLTNMGDLEARAEPAPIADEEMR